MVSLSITNFTKLESFHQAASRAITGCLSSSPISLLLFEASLLLRITLTHFTLSSYERALRFPTIFSYFRFALTWSETKALQIVLESFCIHSCFLLLVLRRLFLLALSLLLGICLPSLWGSPSPLHAPALSTPSLFCLKTFYLSSKENNLFVLEFGRLTASLPENGLPVSTLIESKKIGTEAQYISPCYVYGQG